MENFFHVAWERVLLNDGAVHMDYGSESDILAQKERLDPLFGNTATIAYGGLGTIAALLLCYAADADPVFLVLALVSALLSGLRVLLALGYRQGLPTKAVNNQLSPSRLRYWNAACISGGVMSALVLGVWCFYVQSHHTAPFIVLTAFTATLANMIGICGRNYPSARYVNLQMLVIGLPMITGIWIYGGLLEKFLGALLIANMVSTVAMARSMRNTLDTAVLRGQEIAASEAKLSTAMETVPSGLVMFSNSGRLVFANSEACELLQLRQPVSEDNTYISEAIEILSAISSDPQTHKTKLNELINQRSEPFSFEGRDGRSFMVACGCSPDASLVLRIDDVSEQKLAQARIERLSQYDSLTGIANRERLFERARELYDRFEGRGLAFAVVDVNSFKILNDTHGHSVGDAALQILAKRLDGCVDLNGVCGRLGGDEFVAVQHLDSPAAFIAWCKQINESTNAAASIQGLQLDLSASIGIAHLDVSEYRRGAAKTLVDEAISQADFAQYCAKRDDRKQIQVFDEEMKRQMERTAVLRDGLVAAIDQGTLESAFQVLVDVETGFPKSAEALARWTHPELGPVSPAEFIPLAEQTGAIRDLTIWQLENACRCCAEWPGDISVSVNLSAKDFSSDTIIGSIEKALQQAALDPSRLIIEITETAMLELRTDVLAAITEIRSRGVRVALDDFGTGYSSLSYLHKIPFDILKIDRSFVEAVESDPRQLQVLSGITQLARLLEKSVVIEGIETQEMMDLLSERVDFDLAQGYLFGRPMRERDIATLVSAFGGTGSRKNGFSAVA
ncbi:putative bifunctional diguanylate cyclase/phosphodiesterase [Pseudahrensia aquimaris]|uniref:Bifunctional diguanylate cyclase/phosphodiesterase n=1 Tax=Pseudahrensia aquimaris TaxID=744461 RepID=A0ABW3FMC1_9HYPH